MDTKLSTGGRRGKPCLKVLSILVVVAIALSVTTRAYSEPKSPFLGKWEATDVDGSDMSLSIAGKPQGPRQITWTDNYIAFCNGKAGLIRGTGSLSKSDPNLLEADLLLKCFTTGAVLDLVLTFRYHPAADTLSVKYGPAQSSKWNGYVTIWHRPGKLPTPPALYLRVNYGHDWVESFYESGHTAWILLADGAGNLKATTEVVTEPKDYWGGSTGFQSADSPWFDAEGNPMAQPPDIQPNDGVRAWVDNGASAQVQIGSISGKIDLAADSIGGTIVAPWITDRVRVECLDWGSGVEPPLGSKNGGYILTDGSEAYSCSWAGEWDIRSGQTVGVAYFTLDGRWVANDFRAPNPRMIASEAGNWFWTTEFYPGTLNLYIYRSEAGGQGVDLLWSDQQQADQGGFAMVEPNAHGLNLVPGNYVVVSDAVNEKGLVLERITMEVFDTEQEIMAGTAPAGREVTAGAGPKDWQQRIVVQADPATGAWLADFKTIPFDITEDMRGWSWAQIYDQDGDANEASAPPAPITLP